MANYVQTTSNDLANLRAARMTVGSGTGSGDTFLKVNDRTGEMTYGQERVPLPDGQRFVVPVPSFRHGYIVWLGGKPVERTIIPMTAGARPVPPDGRYRTYPDDGPQDITEIDLHSIEEPGFRLTFSAMSISSANRIGQLLEEVVVHAEKTQEGQEGFVHPVIELKAGMYPSKKFARDVWHFDYEPVDWLHNDGETFLSKRGKKNDEAPLDDDMTDVERELLKG